MTTAMKSRTDALAKVRQLEQEATDLKKDYNEKLAAIFDQIKDAVSMEFDEDDDSDVIPVATAHRGRPAGATNKPAAPARKQPTAAKNGKVAPTDRNYTNPVGLKQTIWEVLDRSHKEWAKHIADLPDDADGLTISEIKEIIEAEGKWKSSSDSIKTQLSSHLTNLKADGLIARADGGRYYIVEGAELVPGKRGRKAAE